MKHNVRMFCATALLVAATSLPGRASSLKVYLSAPFTETAGSSGLPTSNGQPVGTNGATANPNNTPNTLGFAGVSTETFDGTGETPAAYTTLNSTAINGTYTGTVSTFSIKANDQYGLGGQANYLGVPNGGTTTLTLSTPVGYFGLAWDAVDAGNSITLYDQNNAAIGTFNAATFQQLLPNTAGTQITALNGTKYNTTDYFGQPTGTASVAGRQNTGEQYAYLNFVTDPGTKISKLVLKETGAIFENDNHSILTTAPVVNGTSNLVFVTSVPEPSTWALLAAAGGLMMLTIGRRRRI